MVIFHFLGVEKSNTMPVNLHVVIKSSTYKPIVLCTCVSPCHLLNMHGSYGFYSYPFFNSFSFIVSYHNFPDSIRPYRALRHSAVSFPWSSRYCSSSGHIWTNISDASLFIFINTSFFMNARRYAPATSAVMTVLLSCAALVLRCKVWLGISSVTMFRSFYTGYVLVCDLHRLILLLFCRMPQLDRTWLLQMFCSARRSWLSSDLVDQAYGILVLII